MGEEDAGRKDTQTLSREDVIFAAQVQNIENWIELVVPRIHTGIHIPTQTETTVQGSLCWSPHKDNLLTWQGMVDETVTGRYQSVSAYLPGHHSITER